MENELTVVLQSIVHFSFCETHVSLLELYRKTYGLDVFFILLGIAFACTLTKGSTRLPRSRRCTRSKKDSQRRRL